MPALGYAIVVGGWLIWLLPFLIYRRAGAPQKRDTRARWGMILEGIAYALLWQGQFWERSPEPWLVLLASIAFALACLLAWTATRALGRHWRFDAGLDPDHQLIRSGPYRWVRHPIYASMLCLLLGTGAVLTPPGLFAAAIAVFLVGTEIRVRIEDHLLAARFGPDWRAYQRAVPAYIPYLR
ncbi:MAG TPA: isoprenylcysteine carboxylmethyltransferase family protein [Terriglobales bacterium]|jgi:protein-S-isoprenylcysteine O-methyltransferase Ste14